MPSIEGQPYVPGVVDTGGGSTAAFSWGGLLGTLFVVILILFITLWIIKKLNTSAAKGLNAPWVRVLDRQVLGGQQTLYLVEIAGRLQVLGGSDYHLIKIGDIDNPDIAAEILDEISNTPTEKLEGFIIRFLQKLFRQKRKGQDSFSIELEQLLKEVEK
jgi:Flagellar biogenesis protein